MLSKLQLQNFCLVGQGSDACRFLADDDVQGTIQYFCLKQNKDQKKIINDKVSAYFKECRKKGKDPTSEGHPLGDNCAGYPVLRNIEQGYDQKP